VALGTLETTSLFVDKHVLVQIALLRVLVGAAEDWADEGLLLGVYSQVVE
jgi:hypothetical protein